MDNARWGGGLEKGDLEHTTSQEFSEDLWKTEWEVSIAVLEDMEKESRK